MQPGGHEKEGRLRAVLGAVPDAQDFNDFGHFIDFVEQNVGLGDDPFAGAVQSYPADAREHCQVFCRIDQTEQNSLGRVWVSIQQVGSDCLRISTGQLRPLNRHGVPRRVERRQLPEP